MSGGSYHILRMLKDWGKENQISIIMPNLGYRFSKQMLSSNQYQIYFSSTEEQHVEGYFKFIVLYLRRIVKSSFIRFKQHPDIIVASSHLLYDVLPAVILRIRRKSKLVIYVHHIFRSFRTYGFEMRNNVTLLNEKFGLLLCKKADLIFVVNDDVKDALISKGFDADKIAVTGNGIEQESIDSIKVNDRDFDGCFCGRIDKKKGVYDLLEVWERVLIYFPKSKLVIIGHGPSYHDLLKLAKTKTLDKNVILTGFISEEKKFSLIKSSKIFVSASYEEGWGIAVSEAMACGLAVICYNLSAYNIFGDAIIKVSVGNKEQMVQSIIGLLSDEKKRLALADKAKEISKLLNWDNIAVKELKEIYNLLNH